MSNMVASCEIPGKQTGSVQIDGYEGRTHIWPGKLVYYRPNQTSRYGNGSSLSGTFASPVEVEVVDITAKKVRIKVYWRRKPILVEQYRISAIAEY